MGIIALILGIGFIFNAALFSFVAGLIVYIVGLFLLIVGIIGIVSKSGGSRWNGVLAILLV